MSTDAVTLFLALLATVAQLLVLGVLAMLVVGRISAAGARRRDHWLGPLAGDAEALAFAIAATATLGSLYLSEVAHFTPCHLCWLQRACMYPTAALLALPRLRRRPVVGRVCIGLALIGATISSYHVLLERVPRLETDFCDVANPCTLVWVERFGYLTIPGMALSGFTAIVTLLALARRRDRTSTAPSPSRDQLTTR